MKIEAAVVVLTVTVVEMFALVVGGDGSKSNGDKGGRQATATATTWAMVTETRLAGDERGKCKGGKVYDDGDEGR